MNQVAPSIESLLEENKKLRAQLDAKSRLAARALATYQQRVLLMEEHAAELAAANTEREKAHDELGRALAILEEKDKNLSEDLEQARSFQQRILPRLAPTPRLEFAAAYHPVEKVGGDVYDVSELADLSPGAYRVFVADATGHGIQAALRTMILKAEYDRLKTEISSPADVLAELNKRIVAVYPGLELHCSATCFDVIPDPAGASVRYATAAHPPLLIAAGGEARPVYQPGPFLGVVDGIELEEVSFHLAPGQRLFAYTDGLGEQWNKAGEEFGEARVQAALAKDAPLPDLVADVVTDIEAFLGGLPFADDAMVIGLEVKAAS